MFGMGQSGRTNAAQGFAGCRLYLQKRPNSAAPESDVECHCNRCDEDALTLLSPSLP